MLLQEKYRPVMREIADQVRSEGKTLGHRRSKKIWSCWLQGLEEAPVVVKTCDNSLVRHLGVAGRGSTGSPQVNKCRKRYGRKRKHSRATEAMGGGRGYLVPLGVWCQHADVHLPYVGWRSAAEGDREGDEYDRQSNIKFLL